MYPVIYKGWFRVKTALAAVLVGSVLFMAGPWIAPQSDWYDNVSAVILFGGIFYLAVIAEWLRVLFPRRGERDTRSQVLRTGTVVLFIGALLPFVFGLPYHQLVGNDVIYTSSAMLSRYMFATGAIVTTLGIYGNCKMLPGKVETSAQSALRMMKEAGCPIKEDPMWIALNPTLKVAAHTYPADGGDVIIVSPWYVETRWRGGLDNILVHEMAHIYRRETNHLYESHETIRDLEEHYVKSKGYAKKSFQLWTIVQTIIDLGEVLADDLANRVLENSKIDWVGPTREALQKLVREKPSSDLRPGRKRWKNALIVARNSIYTGQMERYKIQDSGDKIAAANRKLLASLPERASKAFEYFQRQALELKDDTDYQQFRNVLEGFLARLIDLAETQT